MLEHNDNNSTTYYSPGNHHDASSLSQQTTTAEQQQPQSQISSLSSSLIQPPPSSNILRPPGVVQVSTSLAATASDSSSRSIDPDGDPNQHNTNSHYPISNAGSSIPRNEDSSTRNCYSLSQPPRSPFATAADMVYANCTYEESYGEAYTGGPMKYIYPSGYQSMRPRSCPWKLSIVVCILFTWLSVFIVGHCSDQVSNNNTYNSNNNNNNNNKKSGNNNNNKFSYNQVDDLDIEIRWCGSRPLYSMWVLSMLITGLSAAYCSVIGYIKIRDFSVANGRSQLPDIMSGHKTKSDYYVRIQDAKSSSASYYYPHHDTAATQRASSGYYHSQYWPPPETGMMRVPSTDDQTTTSSLSSSSLYQYGRPSIYQADGTPQFWGAQIHRPTQAAVALTSR